MKKMLMVASVASMIDQFNMPNIKLLISLGYEVHVAANFNYGNTSSKLRVEEFKKELGKQGIHFHHVGFERNISKIAANMRAYKQIVELIKLNKYTFIHCHSPIGGVCARMAAYKLNIPVIYTAHGFHFFKGASLINWLVYYPVERWMAVRTDILITINSEDYEIAKKKFKANQVHLVNGVGVDINKFKPQTLKSKLELRKHLGYSESEFILLYVGELSPRKHQDLLIHSIHILKYKIPKIKLLLVGLGERSEYYKEKVNDLGLGENVVFLGYRNDIADLMNISDLAVSSSRQEGLPVNVMEAMATGLPLIVTNCRGNRDLVSDGENGFIIGMEDAEGFAKSIEGLYRSKCDREKFGVKSLELIQRYTLDNVAKDMENIYLSIATRK
jgi:glycosyltransferase EpsD